jgi:putative ABC transport system permease protein
VLKGWMQVGAGAGIVRNLLVGAQFAILTVLMIAALVIWQQRAFAAKDGLRVDIDQMLIVEGRFGPAFVQQVRDLSGVKGANAASLEFLDNFGMRGSKRRGKDLTLGVASAERGIFALYGIKPLAGSLHIRPSGEDDATPGVIVTEGAVKRMEIASPQAALGQEVWPVKPFAGMPILAVVPDFNLHSAEAPNDPAVFAGFDPMAAEEPVALPPPDVKPGKPGEKPETDTDAFIMMTTATTFAPNEPGAGPMRNAHIKLSGSQIPETLAAIDAVWQRTGGQGAIKRYFLDVHMQERYVGLLRQAQMFALFAGVAIFLAGLGLIGIAISTADRRTKEIGVRKAAGASSGQIVALLLWQFSRPVLWANLVAWPAGFWLMQRWLSGFSFHITLGPGVFVAASAASLAIAILTVAGQAILVARRKPVLALRYE